MAEQIKTKVALEKQASTYHVKIRHRTRKLIKTLDFSKLKDAQKQYDLLCEREKYRIIQLEYYDKDGALRTLSEVKI